MSAALAACIEPAPLTVDDLADTLTRGQWRRIEAIYRGRLAEERASLARRPSLATLRAIADRTTEDELAGIMRVLSGEQRGDLVELLTIVLSHGSMLADHEAPR